MGARSRTLGDQLTVAESLVVAPNRLELLAERYRPLYATADPCPHAVIDEFLPSEALQPVLAEIPKPGEIDWLQHDDARGKKLASKAETQFGSATRALLYQLNSHPSSISSRR